MIPEQLSDWLDAYPGLALAARLAIVAAVAWATDRLAKRLMLAGVRRAVSTTRGRWDDALEARQVFARLAHLLPAIVVYEGAARMPGLPADAAALMQRAAMAVMVATVVWALNGFLNAVNDLYMERPHAAERPIKGYLQVVKLLAVLGGGIAVVAILMDRSPWVFLSGLGALTAVLLLVFRDTLLSLVASVQLGANDMVRLGDWITVPKYNADGDVIDIALHAIQIRNFDNTVTVVPTHELLGAGFQNWRAMQQSGGRRIKRSLLIDQSTVRHLSDEEIAALGRWALLKDYLSGKRQEVEAWNAAHAGQAGDVVPHRRRLTNLGTFRAYVEAYLQRREDVHQTDMTRMVRQLPPTPDGLPLELYCFTRTTVWTEYEAIQADIFDHLLATVPAFGLRLFQHPSGGDVAALSATGRSS